MPANTPTGVWARVRCVAAALQAFPAQLHEDALLRVHQLGLARRDAEEGRVEQSPRRRSRRVPSRSKGRRERSGQCSGRASSSLKKRDAVAACAQIVPELLDIAAPGNRPAMAMIAIGSWSGRAHAAWMRGSRRVHRQVWPTPRPSLPGQRGRGVGWRKKVLVESRIAHRGSRSASGALSTSSELPPSSKKLSLRPTRSMPRALGERRAHTAFVLVGRLADTALRDRVVRTTGAGKRASVELAVGGDRKGRPATHRRPAP